MNHIPQVALCDRGYSGKRKVTETQILILKPARTNASKEVIDEMRKRFQRRAGIEPVIGHLKSDHRLSRHYLKGVVGDQINLIMAAAAFNFRKWMRIIIFWLVYTIQTPGNCPPLKFQF